MASRNSKTKAGLKAARDAVQAAQREVAERTQRNAEDLATYFSAQERLAGVDDWLAGRVVSLKDLATMRQLRERCSAGAALKAMRDRGESVREIGRLAGIGEKTVRELIRLSDTTTPAEISAESPSNEDGKFTVRKQVPELPDSVVGRPDAVAARA
jgi:hypothetical protein